MRFSIVFFHCLRLFLATDLDLFSWIAIELGAPGGLHAQVVFSRKSIIFTRKSILFTRRSILFTRKSIIFTPEFIDF